jgi:hypothetical protein
VVALDFEERQVHSLTVRARDRGNPSLFSDTNVIVEVVDVNENLHAPLFDDFVVSASIRENQPVGAQVTTVRATDADPPGDDSRVAYSIRGGDGIGLFSIDNEGKIQRFSIQHIKIFRDGTYEQRFIRIVLYRLALSLPDHNIPQSRTLTVIWKEGIIVHYSQCNKLYRL